MDTGDKGHCPNNLTRLYIEDVYRRYGPTVLNCQKLPTAGSENCSVAVTEYCNNHLKKTNLKASFTKQALKMHFKVWRR